MVKRLGIVLATLTLLTCLTVNAQEPLRQEALDYVQDNYREMGLVASDLQYTEVRNAYITKKTGVSHIYINQQFNGINVYNAIMGVHVDKDGEVLHSNHRFVSNLATLVPGGTPALDGAGAIQAAATHLKLTGEQLTALGDASGVMQNQSFRDEGLSPHEIKTELNYFGKDGRVYLVWRVNLRPVGTHDWWDMLVDAQTGEVRNMLNYTIYDHFPSRPGTSAKKPRIGNSVVQGKGPTSEYRAFPIPVESPIHGDIELIADPADPVASPFGWHDTNGIAGPEFTITRGNNVHAYQNRDGFGFSQGDEPDGGPNLSFDIMPDFNLEPVEYVQAATVNLFVWNNFMHDISYLYGFDEASGNFQVTNYTGAGVSGDPVRAHAQSNANTGSTNNATFATPPDGSIPTMNMFEWVDPINRQVTISAPVTIAGDYLGSQANFGPEPPEAPAGISGDVELVDDQTGTTSDACEPLVGFTPGRIAILDRGSCEFGAKVLAAEQAGAIAALVVNNIPEGTSRMGEGAQGGSVTIPSMMISMDDGQLIKDALDNGDTVSVTISSFTNIRRDSDYDNAVIAHEYGHGISNRLTGGPSTTSCLNNQEQMGEGWSDFMGLALTTSSANSGEEPRGIGTYVSFQFTDGAGIRPWPYSTDMSVNPSTYASISSGVSIPHGLGTVWCTMLWDLYWALVDRHGFDDDLYNGTGGNNLAVQLVMDGMKLQICNPGFVDGRDAIIAADLALTGGANTCLIWEVFARRGVGIDASQGSSSVVGDEVESFDAPANCCLAVLISEQPEGATLCETESITLTVGADGTDINYQWRKDGVDLNGETNASFTIASMSANDVGEYTCVVTNDCSSETTNPVDVILVTPPPYSTDLLPGWNGAFPSTLCEDGNGNGLFDVLDIIPLLPSSQP